MDPFENDRLFLDAFRRGDRAALAQVYRTYVSAVIGVLRNGFSFASGGKRLAFHGFSDPLELESFVQDVFLRAFSEEARLAFDGLRPYEPYLLAITRNIALDELRRRRLAADRLASISAEDEGERPHPAPGPEVHVETSRIRAVVRAYVTSLDALTRRYVEVRFERDLSLMAAARELQITRMRARRLEQRVLRGLRKHLQGAGYKTLADVTSVLLMGLL